jgi:hypothetical protein
MILEYLTKENFVPTGPKFKVYDYWYNILVDKINSIFSAGVTNSNFDDAPLLAPPPSTTVFMEDFVDTYGCIDLALANESDPAATFSEVADRGKWLATIVDGGTGNTETVLGRPVDGSTSAGAQGGWGEFRTCNADNDAVTCQLNGESFKLATGKKLWFETQFIIEDVSESEVFIGLADTGTDLYGAAGVGVNNHVGFILDGDGNLDFSVDEAATQSKTDTAIDFVDGTMATLATANVKHKCAFYWDGAGTIKVYVDGTLCLTKVDNGTTVLIPDGTCLSPGFTILTQGTTDEALFIDYIYVAQER